MATDAPAPPGIADGWGKRDWDKLLTNIEDGRVIPIVGRDLLQVSPDEATPKISFYRLMARRLMEALRDQVPSAPIGPLENYTLNDAVCMCLRHGGTQLGSIQDISYTILEVFKEVESWPAPTPLRQLAEITDFHLFVSTTFDPLLERALNSTSIGGQRRTAHVLAYDPKQQVEDLLIDDDRSATRPEIYHLMGRLTTLSSNVVLSDEDLLEFVCALIMDSKDRVPINLLNEFSKNHLLLLGCSFSDWLARFFLRAAKRQRLSARSSERNTLEYVVDDYAPQEKNLVVFLEQFSASTRVFRSTDVIGFVDHLRTRWGERNAAKIATAASSADKALEATTPLTTDMPEMAVFISYAREDESAAERLRAGLKGMPVWFDRAKLEAGDSWEGKIEQNIARCSVFVPIISKTTNRRMEGFFRREWNQAADRTMGMDEGRRFIWPVVIDDTKAGTARVPKVFLRANWAALPGGEPDEKFRTQLRAWLDEMEANRTKTPSPPK